MDPTVIAMVSTSVLAGLGAASWAGLRAWNGWLALKRLEIEAKSPRASHARPELSELRERVRKLEAIASGIEI